MRVVMSLFSGLTAIWKIIRILQPLIWCLISFDANELDRHQGRGISIFRPTLCKSCLHQASTVKTLSCCLNLFNRQLTLFQKGYFSPLATKQIMKAWESGKQRIRNLNWQVITACNNYQQYLYFREYFTRVSKIKIKLKLKLILI